MGFSWKADFSILLARTTSSSLLVLQDTHTNPCGFMAARLIPQELTQRRHNPLTTLAAMKIAEICMKQQTKMVNAKGIHCKSRLGREEEAEEVQVLQSNHQEFQNDISVVAALKVCARQKDLHKGSRLHAYILERGSNQMNIFIGNTMIHMYAKCGALAKAKQVFDDLPFQTVVSWTALIEAYAEHGHGKEALDCFKLMKHDGHSPDAVTLACILKACASIGAAESGEQLHAEIVKEGLLGKFNKLGSALVDMYAKSGSLVKAREVFDELPDRNLVLWTALITGYCQYEHGEEALNCYEQMKYEGFSPDAVTFSCILKACGSVLAAEKGKEVHAEIVRKGLLGHDTVLGSALVDMYAKCGALANAQEVFDFLLVRDVGSWTALITGYHQAGRHHIVLDSFARMIEESIEPNLITLIIVLNACRYLGFLDKGQMYFETMSTRHGIIPTLEHHTCMVDLFGHAGQFDQAMAVIKKMPSPDFLPAWLTLLSACRKWGNWKLGKLAFEHAQRLDEKSAVAYVCMSNIYVAAGMKGHADKLEVMRGER